MHIPDGFISPKVYLPAWAAAVALWLHALRAVRSRLDEETLPVLAVLTALAFVLMTVTIPIPGGTSVHAAGVAILALTFGVRVAFLAISTVLLLQAVLLGAGGVTSLPVNALALGLVGSSAALLLHRVLRPVHEGVALFAAGWGGINAAALVVALVLGLQPAIARDAAGVPLFFPFGPAVTIPAVMIPHLLIGIGEGALTVLVCRWTRRRPGWGTR